MRPKIEALDVDAMAWEPLGPPGLSSKLLSRDPDTGARTALNRLNPADAYEAPKQAHYHHTYEEILSLSGNFSFDSKVWLTENSYVFHPPMTVHGFKSAVPEDSIFLSRIGQALDFNYVPDPLQDAYYLIDDSLPGRAPVAHGDAIAALGWRSVSFLGAAAEACVLSVDPRSGEGSAFLKLPAGWQGATSEFESYLELFVLEGGIALGDSRPCPRHGYFFYPEGTAISPLRAEQETLVYTNFGGPIGL